MPIPDCPRCVCDDPRAHVPEGWSLERWRAANPDLDQCCVRSRNDITDAAFEHLPGIHTLHMASCTQPTITDAAFVHLRGIHTLNMSGCWQETITDAAFVHLRGIHSLDMNCCTQPTITDAAFEHLRGIQALDMSYCTQPTITDAAWRYLWRVPNLITSLPEKSRVPWQRMGTLIAEWAEGRVRRRNGLKQREGSAMLKVWQRLPRMALAEVLGMLGTAV